MSLELIATVLCFSAIVMVQAALHSKERRDLYNRLMARDLTEYQNITGPTPPPRHLSPYAARKRSLEGEFSSTKFDE